MALSVKLACLILGALGIANMYLVIFADIGAIIIAVLNIIRFKKAEPFWVQLLLIVLLHLILILQH